MIKFLSLYDASRTSTLFRAVLGAERRAEQRPNNSGLSCY
ncbi:unnamed protein product [Diplocarpon coronariae]